MNAKVIVQGISLLLVVLMVYAAQAKLFDHANFSAGLSESPIIAPFYSILVWAVPVTELIIAALLLFPATRLAGLWSSLVLMTLFTVYIIVMVSFYDDLPCSCGGILEDMSWGVHIVFNLFFVLLSAWGLVLHRKRLRRLPAA